MPLYEDVCFRPECPVYDQAVERYYSTSSTPQKPCIECGGPTERLMSRFGVVWTGPITAKYNDKESKGAHKEGHWAFRKKSSLSGKPEPVFIETFQQQREFCKAEGLVNPTQAPRNLVVKEDGRTLANTRGMPGTEL